MGKFDDTVVQARKALDVILDLRTRVVRRHHIATAVEKLEHEIGQLQDERRRCEAALANPRPGDYYDTLHDRLRRIAESTAAREQRLRQLREEDRMIKSWLPRIAKDLESAKAYLQVSFESLVERARGGSSEARRALAKVDWAAAGLVLPADLR